MTKKSAGGTRQPRYSSLGDTKDSTRRYAVEEAIQRARNDRPWREHGDPGEAEPSVNHQHGDEEPDD